MYKWYALVVCTSHGLVVCTIYMYQLCVLLYVLVVGSITSYTRC